MLQVIERPKRKSFYFYNPNSQCWNCFSFLDFEQIFFDNLCEFCGNTQDYEKEIWGC